jgi:hypothetical protein
MMSAIRQSIATREWQQCRRVRTGQVETRLGNRKNLKWYLGLSAQRKGQNCCGTCLLGGRLSLPIFGQKVAGTRHFGRNYFLTYQLCRLGGGAKGIRTFSTNLKITSGNVGTISANFRGEKMRPGTGPILSPKTPFGTEEYYPH